MSRSCIIFTFSQSAGETRSCVDEDAPRGDEAAAGALTATAAARQQQTSLRREKQPRSSWRRHEARRHTVLCAVLFPGLVCVSSFHHQGALDHRGARDKVGKHANRSPVANAK